MMRYLALLILLNFVNGDFLCSSDCEVVSNEERATTTNTTADKTLQHETEARFALFNNCDLGKMNVSFHVSTDMNGQNNYVKGATNKPTNIRRMNSSFRTSKKNPTHYQNYSVAPTLTTTNKVALSGLMKPIPPSAADNVGNRKNNLSKTHVTKKDALFSEVKTTRQEDENSIIYLLSSSEGLHMGRKKRAMSSLN